jgi:hypothetical protein
MTIQFVYPFFLALAARSIGKEHVVKPGQQLSLKAVGSVLIVNGLWNVGLFGLHVERLVGKKFTNL